MLRRTIMIAFLFLPAGCQPQAEPVAQPVSEPIGPLDGAWRLVALEDVELDGTRTTLTPQESLFLFADGYYSMAYAVGEQRSPYYAERFSPTDEESLARMNAMTVNAGTFEIAGTRVMMHPLIARVPEFVGGLAEHDFVVSGDTLTLTWSRTVSEDGVEAPGTTSVLTLVRVN